MHLPPAEETPPEMRLRLARWDGVSAATLAAALMPPIDFCAETDVISRFRRPGAARTDRRLGLLLSTASAYRHPIARCFSSALTARLTLSEELQDRVHVALQEALMNALMHGNLGLRSGLRHDLLALATLQEVVDKRLQVAEIARSAIYLHAHWNTRTLQIKIRDSGKGFEIPALASPEARWSSEQSSGRGLLIMNALCDHHDYSHGGTAIRIVFSRAMDTANIEACHDQAD